MLFSGECEGDEREEDDEVELDVGDGNLQADDTEEDKEHRAEDKADECRLSVKDEIHNTLDLHCLVDDRCDDGHTLLDDLRRIG